MTAPNDPSSVDEATAGSIRAQAAVMLRGSLIWAVPLAAVALVVSVVMRQSPGLIGSVIGSAIAIGSGMISAVVMRRTAASMPAIVVGVMSLAFFAKLLVFLALFLVLRDTDLFDIPAFAGSLLVVTIGWTVGECVGLYRAVAQAAPEPVAEVPPRRTL